MKRIFKLFGLALGILLLLSIFGEDVQAQGKLRIGMEVNYSPFNWSQPSVDNGAVPVSNSKGEYANGYDVWMAEQLAKKTGRELEIVKIDWDGLPPALVSGKIDAIIAGMSPTEERKKTIDFTDSYYTSDLVMVVKKDGKYAGAKSLEDFSGAKITGQLNTFHYDVIDQIKGVDKQTALDNFPTMITALTTGKIDGYVSERPGAMSAVAANPDLAFVVFDEGKGFKASEEDTSIAVGVRKGDPIKDEINKAMAEIGEEERQDAMQRMVLLTAKDEENQAGFMQDVQKIWSEYGPMFFRGTLITLFISAFATAFGLIIGLVVQLLRTIPSGKIFESPKDFFLNIIKAILKIYVEVFRGTPMMVQAMIIYYGSKMFFNIDMNAIFAALLIVSINTGAYLSETIRGGIESVDEGQIEAAKAIGLTHAQTMFKIVMPQALTAIFPSIGNELIVNVKDTSVLNVISVTELFFVTKGVAGSTLKTFQAYFIAACIYLFLTLVLGFILKKISMRINPEKPFNLTSGTN